MFKNEHTDAPAARQYRRVDRHHTRLAGAAERIDAAKAKRDRKAAKRAAAVWKQAEADERRRNLVEGNACAEVLR